MDKITDVKIINCEESKYIIPKRMLYKQDGKEKIWDLIKCHDSVAVIIYNVPRKVLIFVKQFRPAVYYNNVEDVEGHIDAKKYHPSLGMTIELCAGIIDKSISLEEIAREEVLEECGYDVPLCSIQRVMSYSYGVGIEGSLQTLYYVEVTDTMKVSDGGGNESEGEYIEVIEMDLKQAYALMYDENIARPSSLILALMWFFTNKSKPT